MLCLWSCPNQEQIRQGCAWLRERVRKSVHVITDNFNCYISLKSTSTSSRGSMSALCYLCEVQVDGPEGVCNDCLYLLPMVEHIKKEDIEVFDRELPMEEWEINFLNDHLQTSQSEEVDEDEVEELDTANNGGYGTPEEIFYSDSSSDDSGYQSPEHKLFQQDSYISSHPSFLAPRTSDEDFHLSFSATKTTDEDSHLSFRAPKTTDQESHSRFTTQMTTDEVSNSRFTSTRTNDEDSHPSLRIANEKIVRFLWQQTEATADLLITQGICPGISFHSG